MSAGLNSLSRVEEVNPCFSLAKIEKRLKEIEKRINTWKKIADKEKIDITEENRALKCIKGEGEKKASAVFNLLLIEECRGRICSRIVRKVQSNIKRVPKVKMTNLKQKLTNLAKIGRSWMEVADDEGVDIAQEKKVWNLADASSFEQMYELLKTKPQNLMHKCEVIWRRLFVLRKQCTLRVIRKTYMMRIKKIGEAVKSRDWFDDKIMVIDGICHDALVAFDQVNTLHLDSFQADYQRVYGVFLVNIVFLMEHREKYQEVADREWLKRQIQEKTNGLIQVCQKKHNSALLKDLSSTYQVAMQLFETKTSTDEIRVKINQAYDLFAERLSVKNSFGCGFNQ